jgi:protein-S-isoprenylcysteine O-methyltransferase Ste14
MIRPPGSPAFQGVAEPGFRAHDRVSRRQALPALVRLMSCIGDPMSRFLMALYALVAYLFFLAVFLLLVAFVGDLPFVKTVDGGVAGPAGAAALTDLALIALFGVQHSVMARPAFKRWWTRIVPAPIERSTYVLAATLAIALLIWQWRPIVEPVLWSAEPGAAAWALNVLCGVGWGVVLLSTFLINHFELFGLSQVWTHVTGRSIPAQAFRTPLLYRHIRHPLYLGFVIAMWATPRMTAGHLLLAAAFTAYILVGIWFEERDLVAQFGERYRLYRQQAGMLFPRLRKSRR